ncbi:tRNA (guanine-N(7)-)-methyltransferase [Rodentibacter pneumotropicus]|uniref:tRNA (guanine(46)-N(7))-methyltransferase n=1 Tax=Rodentibacter pneumotropicus TaxID=758 RepID=A0A3S4TYH1_9PAST|nr:tRNA (guanine-N(7)-)-methyltransferase [Rodentibacter pneumotropicus]
MHTPGVGACIAYAVEKGVKNLRVLCHDATEILRDSIADNTLGGLQLFFPDPWHKAKHHKRRIVQPHFVDQVVKNWVKMALFTWQRTGKTMQSKYWRCLVPIPIYPTHQHRVTIFPARIFVH